MGTKETTLADVAGVEGLHQRSRSLTPPGVDEELLELVDGDRREPDQDGREAVVVGLGKELLRIRAEEHLLLLGVRDADREHVGIGHPGLFGSTLSIQTHAKPFSLPPLRTEEANVSSASSVSGSDSAIRRTSPWSAIRHRWL